MRSVVYIAVIAAFLAGAWKPCSAQSGSRVGKNVFTTRVGSDTREYLVHVPRSYNPRNPAPLVFMLHGTSGDGDRMYQHSGWKELGEKKNVLTVFPSSWEYSIVSQGQTQVTTKWNVYPSSTYSLSPGQTPRDDIRFLRQVLTELHQRFNVDKRRTYLVGFSNGGAMAFRCAVEMSDVLAAVVEASGTATVVATYSPARNIPVAVQTGSAELGVPMAGFQAALISHPKLQTAIANHCPNFDYQTSFTISGNPTQMLVATSNSVPASDPREFRIMLVNNLGHLYPNGTNHPMQGAAEHWQWLEQFTLQ